MRSVSVLGILAIGMGIVVIGRGIDLSMVAVMAMSVAWYLQILGGGMADREALALVLGAVLGHRSPQRLSRRLCRSAGDLRDARLRAPSSSAIVRSQLIPSDAVPVPDGHWVEIMGGLRFLGVPIEVFIFAALAGAVFVFLRFTKWGRYVYYAGDNPAAARNIGIPVRPMLVLRYVLSALTAFVAGLLTAASLHRSTRAS